MNKTRNFMKYQKTVIQSLLISVFCVSSVFTHADYAVENLICEFAKEPMGIEAKNPLLGWQLRSDKRGDFQSAYQIIVSEKQDTLSQNKGDVWNSGKVSSEQTDNILYQGKELKPKTRYYWRVRSYNAEDESSEWSPISYFETGMMVPENWTAQWIFDGNPGPQTDADFYKNDPAPLLRKDWNIQKEIRSARLYISGLGYYEAYLNGAKVSDHFMDPGWTSFAKTILYNTYDVTEMLKQGDNTWGVTLGNGFFNPVPMPIFRPLREYLTIGRPMVIGQLEITYADGSLEKVQTDLSWKTTPGPIMRNNPYLGEHYDARAEVPGWNEPGISTQNWKSVALAEPPTGQLKPQMQPPIRATAILKPVRMTETRPGEFVYDMGQNFAGVVRLKVKGPAGTKITVRYGEDVYSDGSLNVMTTVAGQHKQVWDANRSVEGAPPTAWQEDTYILKGEGEEIWQPRFTFHGFQYIEITGFPGRPTLDNVEGIRLSADLEKVGEFECSDDVVNKIERAVEWTFLSNVFSVQSDCPGREKLGYGGDIAATTDAFCYLFDMHNFYSKTVYDHRDAARPSGAMTETAPYMGIADAGFGDGSGPIGWQLGFAVALKKIHDYYGDIRIVADNYDTLKKQIEFLRAHAQGNIISNCISDHEMIENPRPAALTATGHYYNHVIILAEFARLLGKTEDARTYEQLANEIKAAFIAKFYKPGGIYDSNLQTTQAFALHYDLIPDGKREEVLKQLLNVLDRDGNHIHTGIFATPMLLNQLTENGYSDRAFRLVSNRDYPGWGHMITSGATTIWETWKYSDNIYSHNHPMFGSVNEWFYRALLGINTETPGFETVRISPKTVKGLTWAKGSYRSVKGRISVDWKKNENQLLLNVTIPTGMKAHIYVPHAKGQTIYEGDAKADSVKDIFYRGESGGTSVYDVSGGSYRFTVK